MAVDVDDVDKLHADLVRRDAKIVQPPKDQPYGMRDFEDADLDGNMIFFSMELKKS